MIAGMVQVRMSSTRRPGKVLAEVAGQPMLWHLVTRLRAARRVNQVMIATSAGPADAPIRAFAKAHRIPCFAGSEPDLIDRLYQAAKSLSAEAIVRITGDCPLVDPGVVDAVVAAYQSHAGQTDYVTNTTPPTYPDGLDVEVYPLATLERLWREITEPFWREWFPLYVSNHRDAFRIVNVAGPVDLSALRWTVDYEADLVFVREIYRRLYQRGKVFGMDEILALLKAAPDLANINAAHARNEGAAAALAASGHAS